MKFLFSHVHLLPRNHMLIAGGPDAAFFAGKRHFFMIASILVTDEPYIIQLVRTSPFFITSLQSVMHICTHIIICFSREDIRSELWEYALLECNILGDCGPDECWHASAHFNVHIVMCTSVQVYCTEILVRKNFSSVCYGALKFSLVHK